MMIADADQIGVRKNVRTALVTGGASGIGKTTCELLARDGYRVAIADRDELGGRAVADAVDGYAFALDVTDETAMESVFERALEALGGRLDALATLAGVAEHTAFMDVPLSTLRSFYEINAIGTFLAIREAAKRMETGARICTLASTVTSPGGGVVGTAAYAASKGAVVAITRNAAVELARLGIAVNGIATTTFPGSAAQRVQIAESIVWLMSPDAAAVNGEILTVNGQTAE